MDTMFNDHRLARNQATWTASEEQEVVSGIRRIEAAEPGETIPGSTAHPQGTHRFSGRIGPDIGYPYELVEPIGKGAMGTIWRAHDMRLMRDVAIKIAHGSGGSQSPFCEARLAARAEHPHVVRVYDVGHTREGAPFLVMELLNGRDLSALLNEGQRMSCAEAVNLIVPLLSALDVVHQAQVVHRDIKPSNVFVAKVGDQTVVKLLDFGVASRSEREPAPETWPSSDIVGTPMYMAPELLLEGAHASVASDLFGAAAILFQMITSKQLSPSNWKSLLEVVEGRDLSPLDEHCDARLKSILEKALARNPKERFESAGAFREALLAWQATREA